ncbi:hypothetical protein PV10_07018 [Exophiala mesophila]|uniref:Protein HRI1 n=1 Tax=Exophiala mesophila TaxID=212818 RepID=A0A0D1Z4D4_EXOME|nr:uncharacterized protein PV10_07018 [Exophiala mesophila]KIV89632.1 hypothetical protein PV10_07018 [Exophiala mesophila]
MEFYGMSGERLGTIGQTKPPSPSPATTAVLPQWKKDFLQKPSISVRKGIAWGYSPPYEDTSTLVLTSHKGDFVDIRFPVTPEPGRPLTSNPSFWAFSGQSHTTFDEEAHGVTMPYSAHAVFNHVIDSKGPGISDEGDMFLLPNGDCIEVGMMQNPSTGKEQLYKEYWTGPPAESGNDDGPRVRRSPCVVAKTVASTPEVGVVRNGRGAVIRIGDYCQGILQRDDVNGQLLTLVERWSNAPDGSNAAVRHAESTVNEVSGARWIKDWRSNTVADMQHDSAIPSIWICGDGHKVGDEIVVDGVTWRVVEVEN